MPAPSLCPIVPGQPEAFLASGDPFPLLAERTGHVDRLVTDAVCAELSKPLTESVSVLAVGGYGRQELFPCSDIDLLFLIPDSFPVHDLKEPLARLVRTLWDAGLRASQSVRTLSEAASVHEGNYELTISLLDRRLLTGDSGLMEQLNQRWPALMAKRGKLLRGWLAQSTRERHAKFHDSYHHLEPDIKEGPGAWRDTQVLPWLRQLGASLPGREVPPEARQVLAAVRCLLHLNTGRDSNRLTFEQQDRWAATPFAPSPEPAECMRHLYRACREVQKQIRRALDAEEYSAPNLLGAFRDRQTRLSNAEFTVARQRVYLRVPQALETDAGLIFRLFAFVARHGIRLADDTADRLTATLRLAPGLPWPALEEIFSLPHVSLALREMQASGVLAWLLPEWQHLDCLVVRDFYHRYTVDEHTLVTVDTWQALRYQQDQERRPFSTLATELEYPALLPLALLLHDLGKGRGGDHEQRSAELAAEILPRWGLPLAQQEMVDYLIRSHLVLSSVMTSRDLSDPATGQQIAEQVGTVEKLKSLTVMTYSDISAVHPGAMTPWRAEQLWRAYRVGYQALTKSLETSRITAPAIPGMGEFLEGFPTRYLHTHTPDEMRVHEALARQAQTRGVAVDLAKHEGTWQATTVTHNRAGLFAALAGALSSFGLDILKAEAFHNRRGLVLDTFRFSDPHRNLDLNPSETERLRRLLEQTALNKMDITSRLRARPKPVRHRPVEASVACDSQTSPAATLVEITAEDRPGLLYDLASAISGMGCDIEVVLVDTEAHRALDVFYVTREGHPLPPEVQAELQHALLTACQG